MQNIAIFCKTLLKGGAEKQALILLKLLSEDNKNVILINWSRDKVDPEHLTYIDNNSLKYFALKGNWLTKYFHFLKIVRAEKISIVLSYLTLVNFIAGTSKLFLKDVTQGSYGEIYRVKGHFRTSETDWFTLQYVPGETIILPLIQINETLNQTKISIIGRLLEVEKLKERFRMPSTVS